MIKKEELIAYLTEKVEEMRVIGKYYMYDCGKDLNICEDLIKVAQKMDGGNSVKIYFHRGIFDEIKCPDDVKSFVNRNWEDISEVLKLCDSEYCKTRWNIVVKEDKMEFDRYYKDCAKIYTQITGWNVYGGRVNLKNPIERVNAISDDLWKVGEILVKHYESVIVSPISRIDKMDEGIVLYKKRLFNVEYMDKLGKMLFKNRDEYIIKDIDSFVTILEIGGLI